MDPYSTLPTAHPTSSSSSSHPSDPPTLLSVFEFVVHFFTFRNIDLFRQGLYQLRTQLYTQHTDAVTLKPHKHLTAMPYHIIQPPPPASALPMSPALQSRCLSTYQPAQAAGGVGSMGGAVYGSAIDDSNTWFHSSVFRVQYCDQSIVLNNSCLFRLELPSTQQPLPAVLLDVDLWYADWSTADVQRGREMPLPSTFERVSGRTYSMERVWKEGVHCYVPVVMDESHCCLVETMVHSMLIEYRYRVGSAQQQQHNLKEREEVKEDRGGGGGGERTTASTTVLSPPPSPSVSTAASVASTSSLPSASSNPVHHEPSSTSSVSTTPSASPLPLPQTVEPQPNYPPFAYILFPRLLTPPTAMPTSPSPSVPAYTAAELASITDRYHHFLLTNLIRAYNHLALTFDMYVHQCVNEEERQRMAGQGVGVKPLRLNDDMIQAEVAEQQEEEERKEERKEKEENRYLRPTAIDTKALNGGGHETVSPSSPSILLSAPHSARHSNSSASNSRSTSPQPSPPLPSQAAESSVTAATKRHTARRKRSFDHRTHDDYTTEQSHQQLLALLRDKYQTPHLSRLSHRLGAALNYESAARTVLSDMRVVSQQCYHLWNVYLPMLPVFCDRLFAYARRQWEAASLEHWSSFVFRESYPVAQRTRVADDAMYASHMEIATIARRNAAVMVAPLAVREVEAAAGSNGVEGRDRGGLMGDHENQVVVFEEAYSRRQRRNTDTEEQQQRDDERQDAAGSEEEDNEQRGDSDAVTADGIDVEIPKEIESVDIDHSTTTTTGVDSRPIPTVLIDHHEAGSSAPSKAGSPTNASRPRHSLSLDIPFNPSAAADVACAVSQPASASLVPTADRASLNRSGSQPSLTAAITLPLVPSTLSSSSFSIVRSTSSSSTSATSAPPLPKLCNPAGKHVWILCHGYQGNSWDLRLFKHQLSLSFPDALIFLSSSNEQHTEGDIAAMGARLAHEVAALVTEHCADTIGRLSFVGHSLGGIIVRSALLHPVLSPLLPYCHSYLSFASPHLGYLYAESPFLSTGMWLLKKWNNSRCLSQLSLTDSATLDDTFMYRLSEDNPLAVAGGGTGVAGGLRWFEHVFLFGSQQDRYVPFHSTRMELCREAVSDVGVRGRVYERMVGAVLRGMEGVSVKRFDVNFVSRRKSLDTLIGRAAHIYFLDNIGYMQLLVSVYRHYLT